MKIIITLTTYVVKAVKRGSVLAYNLKINAMIMLNKQINL